MDWDWERKRERKNGLWVLEYAYKVPTGSEMILKNNYLSQFILNMWLSIYGSTREAVNALTLQRGRIHLYWKVICVSDSFYENYWCYLLICPCMYYIKMSNM
jgi:hypothetical protein